jgi:hypothetical protein
MEDFIAKDETKKWMLPNKAETPLLDVTPDKAPSGSTITVFIHFKHK